MKFAINRLWGMLAAAVLAVALLAPLSARAAELPESDDPIRFALNDWSVQQAITHIAGEILTRLGYNVEYVVAGTSSQFVGLMEGDLDATLEVWEFTGEQLNRALDSGKVEMIGDIGVVPREGLLYPAHVEDQCPGLPDWKALEKCAELFGTPETLPKGRIIDYPADWGYDINKKRVEAYFGDKFVMVPGGSEGTMVAELRSAIARKQPLLTMFFALNYIWLEPDIDLRWVEFEPAYQEGCDDNPSLGLFPDRVADCDWDVAWVRKLAGVGVKDKWPVAYKFLKEFSIGGNATYNRLGQRIDGEGERLEDVAKSWVDDNEEIWRPWVDAAMAGS